MASTVPMAANELISGGDDICITEPCFGLFDN